MPKNGQTIKLNGNIAVTCVILKLVAASAAKAELGALFLNTQEARIIRLTLMEMGHPQPPTPIHVDNITCVVIVSLVTGCATSFAICSIATGSKFLPATWLSSSRNSIPMKAVRAACEIPAAGTLIL